MSLKNLLSRLRGKLKPEEPVMSQGNAGTTAAEVHAMLDEAKQFDNKVRAEAKHIKAKAFLDSLPPGECPKCRMVSHHPMDQFFKWCANCDLNYSGVVYANGQRAELGQIHDEFPDYTLEETVAFYHSMR
jgi:hypothetical protein